MSELAQAFTARYHTSVPRLFRAPGRINLIGEHTDYNGGLVMPAAIERTVWIAAAARPDRTLRLHSEHFGETAVLSLDEDEAAALLPTWSRSLCGVALLLERRRRLSGADLLLRSDIPVGAGLSSSAATEVAVGWALASISGISPDRTELALLCQQASHEFAGSRCGIMDQFIACHGRSHQFLELDTRSLSQRWLPWPGSICLLACDTSVCHDNASGEYNLRREQCEAAVALLRRWHPDLASLRDLAAAELEAHRSQLPSPLYARCRHVVSENARVAAAAAALAEDDCEALGAVLNASHASLRDDYQVSCPELDLMAEICRRQPGIIGARMMGAGFGGCVLALARPERAEALCDNITAAYAQASGLSPQVWVCRSAGGVSEIPNG